MDEILLTDKELGDLIDTKSKSFLTYDEYEPFLKAQSLKTKKETIKWLEEDCTEHQAFDECGIALKNKALRRKCPKCWQRFKEEVGL